MFICKNAYQRIIKQEHQVRKSKMYKNIDKKNYNIHQNKIEKTRI